MAGTNALRDLALPPQDNDPAEWLYSSAIPKSLKASAWPASMSREDDGSIAIAGVHASFLAQKYRTPLYVIDASEVRTRAKNIREIASFNADKFSVNVHVCYAAKAFLCTAVARWMNDAGLRIAVCSGLELTTVLAAGVHPFNVEFYGNNKSFMEIDRAVRCGVGSIIIDHASEVDQVAMIAQTYSRIQPVRLRIANIIRASTGQVSAATAFADQKFGVAKEDALQIVERIRAYQELQFLGLHNHIGTQIFGSWGFREAATRLLHLHKTLQNQGPVPELNLGGGFGIPYVSSEETTMSMNSSLSNIMVVVAAACNALDMPMPDLVIEPGRWIIGPAGVTLSEVGAIKDVRAQDNFDLTIRRYISIDGGFSGKGQDANRTVCLAGRSSIAAPALVQVVGKHGDVDNVVVEAGYLPEDVIKGDILAVAGTGAYCYPLLSNYNLLPRPAVVAIEDEGPRLIVTHEAELDVLCRDMECAELHAAGLLEQHMI